MIQPYSESFFIAQQDGSLHSAEVVVPVVLSLFDIKSVVDVGCGVGGWLSVFKRFGVDDILGMDGDYVPEYMLKIPTESFVPFDLQEPIVAQRRFDMACSLEVAEHLPEGCADQLVRGLVSLSRVVLFSAAIPGQGGTNHLNEQWQSYWARLFSNYGYVAIDCVRPAIYHDERVQPWYKQNLLVFCDPSFCLKGYCPVVEPYDLDRVHPGFFTRRINDIVAWYEGSLEEERRWHAAELDKFKKQARRRQA